MDILEFIRKIKDRGLLPKTIQMAEWRSWTMVSCYSGISSKFISESVSQGIDKDPKVALAKALSEFLERKLSKESTDEAVRLTERSDGFAAYPIYENKMESSLRAANNAKNEAIERYLWSMWWDHRETPYRIRECRHPEINYLRSDFSVKLVNEVIVSTGTHALLVLIAETENGGIVTGGAAGMYGEERAIYARAFGELLRHLIVVKNILNGDQSELSFYERRLWGFASGNWTELVRERLSVKFNGQVILPRLILNRPIIHSATDLVSIHRVLFENQPVFLGGPVERLCI